MPGTDFGAHCGASRAVPLGGVGLAIPARLLRLLRRACRTEEASDVAGARARFRCFASVGAVVALLALGTDPARAVVALLAKGLRGASVASLWLCVVACAHGRRRSGSCRAEGRGSAAGVGLARAAAGRAVVPHVASPAARARRLAQAAVPAGVALLEHRLVGRLGLSAVVARCDGALALRAAGSRRRSEAARRARVLRRGRGRADGVVPGTHEA
mmetsp:Transcript_23487/g.89231  ORF Transcript_23487/g.89231 Transcript_23487/m.89231 type:complete len:215 (-) Transcript_23487:695-1339(-)